MATSDTLLQRWHRKLVDASTATRSKSVRSQWLGTLYVRLYQFLLSVYGPDGWGRAVSKESPDFPVDGDSKSATGRADASLARQACGGASGRPFAGASGFCEIDACAIPPFARQAFVDNTSEICPTKPRSIDAIRGVLDRIHEDVGDTVPQKPRYESNGKPDWLVVATSREISLRKCRRMLSRAGIEFRTRWFANYSVLEVPQKQFEDSIVLIRHDYRIIRKIHGQLSFIDAWIFGIGLLGPVSLSIWGVRVFHSVEMATDFSMFAITFGALTVMTVFIWVVLFKRILNA